MISAEAGVPLREGPRKALGAPHKLAQAVRPDRGLSRRPGGLGAGKGSRAVAIKLVHDDKAIRRVPLNHRRPDIAGAFPDVLGAEDNGFKTTVSRLLRLPPSSSRGCRACSKTRAAAPSRRSETKGARAEARMSMWGGANVGDHTLVQPGSFPERGCRERTLPDLPHFQVVIVVDGSMDNTFTVGSRYPGVRCVRQEKRGLAGAQHGR
jgi:hypothetical protein